MGLEHLEQRYRVPVRQSATPHVVMNGNQALALGIMASGIEVCAMYPITPATSVSHYPRCDLPEGRRLRAPGGGRDLGDRLRARRSYAGKTAVTVTSGPGLALKTEFLGLAVMAELPLVDRGRSAASPSTGLPTRVEQGDLLAALHGEPGDAPKIVLAPSTIEECFHFVITARKLAETFRTPVLVLTDANLATGAAAVPAARGPGRTGWRRRSTRPTGDATCGPTSGTPETGLSQRPIPGPARRRLHR